MPRPCPSMIALGQRSKGSLDGVRFGPRGSSFVLSRVFGCDALSHRPYTLQMKLQPLVDCFPRRTSSLRFLHGTSVTTTALWRQRRSFRRGSSFHKQKFIIEKSQNIADCSNGCSWLGNDMLKVQHGSRKEWSVKATSSYNDNHEVPPMESVAVPSRMNRSQDPYEYSAGEFQENGYMSVSSSASAASAALPQEDYGKFVRYLHLASPYVIGHRQRTFVISIGAEVILNRIRIESLLNDVLLLHGLGVRIVLVLGARNIIDRELTNLGISTGWQGAYRVTDEQTMRVAMEVAGSLTTEISAALSRAPSVSMLRRHSRGEGPVSFAPAVSVVSGNFVTAKRRGIVGGVDFGSMGQVRFVQRDAVIRQLDASNIVLLTNIGVSSNGDMLNCNSYDVATHAAVELQAEKLICIHDNDEVRSLNLPHYLPLADAEELIRLGCCAENRIPSRFLIQNLGSHAAAIGNMDQCPDPFQISSVGSIDNSNNHRIQDVNPQNGDTLNGFIGSSKPMEMLLDLDTWQQIGFPNSVVASVVALRRGVKRSHIVDASQEGALLLEMYTRDGIPGVCMISADIYEGIRPAGHDDISGVVYLLALLQADGHALPFPPSESGDHLSNIIVMSREGKVLGCAVTLDLGEAEDGVQTYEICAFIIEPSYRRLGFGDSLIDYVEQSLRRRGARRVVIVAGQGSIEWFAQRGFALVGNGSSSKLLPQSRKKSVPHISKLYAKSILDLDEALDAPEGKRIGF